jgi:hypothetical protein
VNPDQPTSDRRWRIASWVLLGVAAAVTVSWNRLVWAIGGLVIPGWGFAAAVLAAAASAGLVGRRIRRRSATPGAPPRRWLVRSVAVLSLVGTLLAAADDGLGSATYTVLSPSGPGCRAVVRETSALMIGYGSVYAVSPLGLGWRVGDWRVDDGYRPIGNGTYELSWGVGGGVLQVMGTSVDPVLGESLQGVTCRPTQ